jgi:Holliday junction resolvasome RuvABC ATP-dependent DNA helicase subunit
MNFEKKSQRTGENISFYLKKELIEFIRKEAKKLNITISEYISKKIKESN